MTDSLNAIAEIITTVLGDQFVFPAFQTAFCIFVTYALIHDKGYFRNKGGATVTVQRGKESWASFHLMYGFLAFLFVEVNNTTDAAKGYKTVITLLDLVLLFYLCFFNGWFRDHTLRLFNASQQMKES